MIEKMMKIFHKNITHYWITMISATLIKVYDGPHISDKWNVLIAIKFKAVSLSLFSSHDQSYQSKKVGF